MESKKNFQPLDLKFLLYAFELHTKIYQHKYVPLFSSNWDSVKQRIIPYTSLRQIRGFLAILATSFIFGVLDQSRILIEHLARGINSDGKWIRVALFMSLSLIGNSLIVTTGVANLFTIHTTASAVNGLILFMENLINGNKKYL